jgi:hypothetical protein
MRPAAPLFGPRLVFSRAQARTKLAATVIRAHIPGDLFPRRTLGAYSLTPPHGHRRLGDARPGQPRHKAVMDARERSVLDSCRSDARPAGCGLVFSCAQVRTQLAATVIRARINSIRFAGSGLGARRAETRLIKPARRGAGFVFIPVFKIYAPKHVAGPVRERPWRGGGCR